LTFTLERLEQRQNNGRKKAFQQFPKTYPEQSIGDVRQDPEKSLETVKQSLGANWNTYWLSLY